MVGACCSASEVAVIGMVMAAAAAVGYSTLAGNGNESV